MTSVTTLGLGESARLLWGLTRGDRVRHLNEVATRYPDGGLLVTPLNRMLITATASATKHVLVTHHRRYRKGLGQAHAGQVIGDGLLTAEGATWQSQRADAAPLLKAKAVERHLTDIADLAMRSVQDLAQQPWSEVDPAVHLASYTLRCLSHTMGFTAPDAATIHDAFEAVQDEALFRSVTQEMLPLRWRPRTRKRVHAALADLAAQASASLEGQQRSESWASPEGMTSLFLAGYETTASTLAWALVHLAARPSLQQQLRDEAWEVVSEEVTAERLARLRLTECVFKETLRLRPPVWLISRRLLEADTVDGVGLRPGDEVLLLPTITTQHEWLDPREFRPQRFLDSARGSALWFGAGPRACPGGALANAEALLWLAHASAHLDLRLLPGRPLTPLARMSQAPADDLRNLIRVQPSTALHTV